MAQVTLGMDEYRKLIDNAETAQKEVALLQAKLAEMSSQQGDPKVKKAFLNALVVVSHAVANLPPETTRGWPVSDLQALATALLDMPDIHEAESLSLAWRLFAQRTAEIDAKREYIIAGQKKWDEAHPNDLGPGAEHFADQLARPPQVPTSTPIVETIPHKTSAVLREDDQAATPTPGSSTPEPIATTPDPGTLAQTTGGASEPGAPV